MLVATGGMREICRDPCVLSITPRPPSKGAPSTLLWGSIRALDPGDRCAPESCQAPPRTTQDHPRPPQTTPRHPPPRFAVCIRTHWEPPAALPNRPGHPISRPLRDVRNCTPMTPSIFSNARINSIIREAYEWSRTLNPVPQRSFNEPSSKVRSSIILRTRMYE